MDFVAAVEGGSQDGRPWTLVTLLVAHREDMFRLWMAAIRREAPEMLSLSDADLVSNFPMLFDRLIRGLEGELPPRVMLESREHALTRKRQGIGLATLLREYTLLQQTIRSFASEKLGARPGDSDSRKMDVILFRAVEEAVLTYSASKDAECEDARSRMGGLIAELAHDIRAPLNAMALTLTIMEMRNGDHLDDEDREDLAAIQAGIATVVELHRGILDHFRFARSELVLNPTKFSLDGEVAHCVRVVQSLATYKGLEFVKDLTSGVEVFLDKAMFQQIVGNLLSNAIRYTDRGRVTVRTRSAGGFLRVEVEDTGIGMTPEDQARVFEEFFQVSGNPRESGEGYGLGLTVAYRVAVLIGGVLSVSSELGRGSKFTLSLPQFVPGGGSVRVVEGH